MKKQWNNIEEVVALGWVWMILRCVCVCKWKERKHAQSLKPPRRRNSRSEYFVHTWVRLVEEIEMVN